MADETLLLLLKDVRGKTLKIMEDVTESQALFAPAGLHNSILWHAGHALIVVEHLGVSAATGKPPAFHADWFDKFSWKSEPAKVTAWPALADVRAKLVDQAERLSNAINGLSEEQLKQPWGDATKGRSVRYAILHGLHDEANHQGEMWLLKKLQRKPL